MKSKTFSPFKRLQSIITIFKKRKVIIPMFKDIFTGNYRMPILRVITFIAALAYLIWPIDLVPDFIIGLGWIDDLIIFSFVSRTLEEELKKYQYHKDMIAGKPVILATKWK